MRDNIYNSPLFLIIMCKACRTKPVYEFTNQRKLCKNCFIQWFQKKFLYTIRKFGMIKRGDVVSVKGNDYRAVVLKYLLGILEEKGVVELASPKGRDIMDSQLASPNCSLGDKLRDNKSSKLRILAKQDLKQHYSRAERGLNKIAVASTLDSEAEKIVSELISGDEKNLKNLKPVDGKVIKPLYLFLDEEVLLYAKLRGLKIKKGEVVDTKISRFINELETKHPEIKRAVVSSYLKIYGK